MYSVAESPAGEDDAAMPTRDAHPERSPRFVAGTMTGTSIDGDLDAALVEIRGSGVGMQARFIAGLSHPLGDVADGLRRIAAQEPMTAGELARIARAFGEAHAHALAELCSDAGVQPDLAVLHGQTVFHAPPLTWQFLDPWPVAVRLRCRIRYDLRGANVASGGQGAPITPLADFVLFGDERAAKVVMNLGGFINVTYVPQRAEGIESIRGFDLCACNHLLDRVARTRLGAGFDRDGAAASCGTCDEEIVTAISRSIAPDAARGSMRRSLGTGDEAAKLVELTSKLGADDACRTIVEAIADAAARTLAREVPKECRTMLLAGGSARNQALQAALARRSGMDVRTTDDPYGIPVHMREPAEIAILGALAEDGVRFSLQQVTGAASQVPESAVLEGENPAENTQD
jgi:anhydro-N-acetylmuramic acid kinase